MRHDSFRDHIGVRRVTIGLQPIRANGLNLATRRRATTTTRANTISRGKIRERGNISPMLLHNLTRGLRRRRQTSDGRRVMLLATLGRTFRNVNRRPLFACKTIITRRRVPITSLLGLLLRSRRVLNARARGTIRLNTILIRHLNRQMHGNTTRTTTGRDRLTMTNGLNKVTRETCGILRTITRLRPYRLFNNHTRRLRSGNRHANNTIVIHRH